MPESSSKKIYVLSVVVIIFYFIFILIRTAFFLHFPLIQIIEKFSYNFYFPHTNFFLPGYVGGVNINHYFYELVFMSTLLVIALQRMLVRAIDRLSHLKTLVVVSTIVYVFMTGWQAINQVEHLRKIQEVFAGKTLDQRLEIMFGHTYRYARDVKEWVPGKHTGELITSLDISQDPGMFMYRALAYHLYPVDIRGIRGEPADCLIVFMKDHAVESVPPDYRILHVFDDQNLLAVKR